MEPLWAVAACLPATKEQFRCGDAHNAASDKLEPITIFVSLPQGPQWACTTWEQRWAKGGSEYMVCVCLVEEGGGGVVVMGAHRAANQTPLGKKKSAARRSSHHKNIMKRDPGSTFYFSFFSISIRAGWLLTIKRPSR